MASAATPTEQKNAPQQIHLQHLWRTGLLILVTAAVANFLIATAAESLFAVASTFTPLQPGTFIRFTVMGTLGAGLVFALLGRFTRRPVEVLVLYLNC